MNQQLIEFVRESNKIEGILREPTQDEIEEFYRFINLEVITVEELKKFVKVYQPDARLRDKYGLNVRVGRYYPPFGSPEMVNRLETLLEWADYTPFELHVIYEKIHPFTDCNGRSGRALWAWKHKDLALGFLHAFYYQTLDHMEKYEEIVCGVSK